MEKAKITNQTIKSGLVYQKRQKVYFAKCSFCGEIVEKDKEIKNRSQLRF